MAFCSLRLSPLSLYPRPPLPARISPLRADLPLSISCSLLSPCPRSRRKNYLRPKIHNCPLPPSPPPPSSHEAIESSLLFVEEMEAAEETFAAFEVSDALLSGAVHRWFPGSVLDLVTRFAALLAVQTAVAVWFLSSEDVKDVEGGESNEDGFKEKEKVTGTGTGTGMEVEDFERMVGEIREMARDAREREAEGILDGGGVMEGVGKRVDRKKKSIARIFMDGKGKGLVEKKDARKLKLKSGEVGYLPKVKGFGCSKPIRSEIDLGKECRKREPEKLPDLNNVPISTQRKIEESKCTTENSTSNDAIKSGTKDSKIVFPGRESNNRENLAEKNLNSSMLLTRDDKPQSGLQNNEAKSMPVDDRDKESLPRYHENQWWLKLSYVFGIFLHSPETGDKGLYSLRMNSAADDENQPSYTIAFQDRGDAMNFSYLLESFFEDLGDVSAKIVPLTIHELNEAIKAGELKLIVASKGQVRLYAGQPLVEVENSLRSLLE